MMLVVIYLTVTDYDVGSYLLTVTDYDVGSYLPDSDRLCRW